MSANVRKFLRIVFLSAACGVLAGLAAAVFLFLLEWATETREDLPLIIFGLPLAGLLIGWVYHEFGRDVAPGNNLIIDEIHDPKKTVPLRMAPLIMCSTVITHLFGGSAGREGTVVQMGAALADQLGRWFGADAQERRRLLMAGAGAGFGAAIGAPWAGAVFGLEMIHVRRLHAMGLLESLIASFAGYAVTLAVGAPHTLFQTLPKLNFDLNDFLFISLAGMAFGLTARLFVRLTHSVERIQASVIKHPALRPMAGGILLVGAYAWEQSTRYAGLGLPVIQQALAKAAGFRDPLLKLLFTALTIGSGFKGGEFIPLVFIGATLGSALSALLPVSHQLLAAVGFAAVFGAAANTPIACAVMACEIFGWSIAPYAFAGTLMAYAVSGRKGIYPRQR